MSTSSSGKRYATIRIGGMTCHACEQILEEALSDVPGVLEVKMSAHYGTATIGADASALPNQNRIAAAIKDAGYQLMEDGVPPTVSSVPLDGRKWMEIGAALLIIFAGYKILEAFDVVSLAPSTSGALSLGGVLLIGLVAGMSSCLAVTGGLLLVMAAKWNETHQNAATWTRLRPLLTFNAGRLISYFVLGGLTGVIGQSIILSTRFTGLMTIVIALVMLYLALTILEIIPKGSCPIRPPRSLSCRIRSLSESDHPLAPFTLGALTFFLPCGFTQSLQFAALASGSFLQGALMLFVFALGTLPSLLGLSAISSTARGTSSRLFLRFSGTFVLILAFWNIQSGLALTGVDLSLAFSGTPSVAAALPPIRDGAQEVSMNVTRSGYEPKNLTIRAGMPVRWLVNGDSAAGCTSVLVIPTLNISQQLRTGTNVIQFTAPNPGQLAFSCSMGMVRGSFTVI